jgi:2-haloacid dehalogenase
MLGGPIAGTLDILRELRAAGTKLYALTNWSQETFPIAVELYDFLGWFDGIVVSGQEGRVKPDPLIYQVLLDRYGLDADHLVYIDDNPANAAAATRLGMHGLHFTDPPTLRTDLAALGLLDAPP